MSFTPINANVLTQGAAAKEHGPNEEATRCSAKRRKTVAGYLGEKGQGSLPPGLVHVVDSNKGRGKARTSERAAIKRRPRKPSANAQNKTEVDKAQRRVSEGLRVTKASTVNDSRDNACVGSEVTPTASCDNLRDVTALCRDRSLTISDATQLGDEICQADGATDTDLNCATDMMALVSPVTSMDSLRLHRSTAYSNTPDHTGPKDLLAATTCYMTPTTLDLSGSVFTPERPFHDMQGKRDAAPEGAGMITTAKALPEAEDLEDSDLDDLFADDYLHSNVTDANRKTPLTDKGASNDILKQQRLSQSASGAPPDSGCVMPSSPIKGVANTRSNEDVIVIDSDIEQMENDIEKLDTPEDTDFTVFDYPDDFFNEIDENELVERQVESEAELNASCMQTDNGDLAVQVHNTADDNRPANKPQTFSDVTSTPSDTANPPPIIRPSFPASVRDRSPVIGLTSDIILRTCFRIGEALKIGSHSVRNNVPVIIELYAKVKSSSRDGAAISQTFVLADLFHDHAPFLEARYNTWKGAELWEFDCGRLLTNGEESVRRLCRCMGKMKREDTKWFLQILSIWEATWEDVEHTQAVVCA